MFSVSKFLVGSVAALVFLTASAPKAEACCFLDHLCGGCGGCGWGHCGGGCGWGCGGCGGVYGTGYGGCGYGGCEYGSGYGCLGCDGAAMAGGCYPSSVGIWGGNNGACNTCNTGCNSCNTGRGGCFGRHRRCGW